MFFWNRDDKAFSARLPALMDARQEQLRGWAEAFVSASEPQWSVVAGDASGRRYFRLRCDNSSYICVDSPPDSEKNEAFLAIRALMAAADLPVPELYASDLERGLLLLQDLGDELLYEKLARERSEQGYDQALDLLLSMQAISTGSDVPPYSADVLREEFSRFYEWFCLAYLGLPEDAAEAELVAAFGEELIASAQAQPQVFVHRDYHCRNLILQPDDSLAIIDFQDAVVGPLCYDLAGLLRDCYIQWPRQQVKTWALEYRQRLLEAGRPAGEDDACFLRWFDWVGLHRHIKCLGNFTRLSLRDGKHGYLQDIPLVLAYITEVLGSYPEFSQFARWFDERLQPLIASQDWKPPS